MKNAAAFVKLALKRPAHVGALVPSSRHLARGMAHRVGRPSRLIELGAGTGAVTAALQEARPHVPLQVVELEPDLAARLRRRFPGVPVHCAAAHEVLHALRAAPKATVVVSSLPFRSLPEPLRSKTLRALLDFLEVHPSRSLVQYTYQPRAPFELPANSRLRWRLLEVIWRNLPPAGVWMLQRVDN
jgi:phosphatidylethanolamine/phosphatidyl-N-methylethanolamine N-methyltransferase